MNFKHLQSTWQSGNTVLLDESEIASLAMSARSRVTRYRRQARWRIVYGATAFCLALGLLAVIALLPGVWLGMRVATVLWALAMIACLAGMWPLLGRAPDANASLKFFLQAGLAQLHQEIAYQRSLRWRFWLPFAAGLGCALLPRVSPHPDASWLLLLFAVIGCSWGFVYGPRHWPERLRDDESTMDDMLRGIQQSNHQGVAP